MTSREYAKRSDKSSSIPIEQVPEFRRHLQRNGLRNLAEWEAKNAGRGNDITTDAEAAKLLQRRAAMQGKR